MPRRQNCRSHWLGRVMARPLFGPYDPQLSLARPCSFEPPYSSVKTLNILYRHTLVKHYCWNLEAAEDLLYTVVAQCSPTGWSNKNPASDTYRPTARPISRKRRKYMATLYALTRAAASLPTFFICPAHVIFMCLPPMPISGGLSLHQAL